MTPSMLSNLVADQREQFLSRDCGVARNVDLARILNNRQIVVISGVRRCGKSTLLRQIAAQCGNDFHYLNLDDERLFGFELADFEDLILAFGTMSGSRTLLLDEIQNVEHWERFVRRIHDDGYKVFLTGSNAQLLSSELGTRLTGRYSLIELFPFSFLELLAFYEVDSARRSTAGRAAILKIFDQYLEQGGFPEFLRYEDREFLTRTYEDILHRDIITRFGIRDVQAFRRLAHYAFTNFTTDMSYNGVSKTLDIASPVTVRDYFGYLELSYLTFEIFKFDFSLKKQHVSNKKIFVIDNGMRNMVAFRFSKDLGRLLENAVFVELRRHNAGQVYFLRDRGECDFVVVEHDRVASACQVCYELTDANRERELNGLRTAMQQFDLKQGTILTYNQSGAESLPDGRTITILPTWQWMIEQHTG